MRNIIKPNVLENTIRTIDLFLFLNIFPLDSSPFGYLTSCLFEVFEIGAVLSWEEVKGGRCL
jgi:hypothetical protein